MLDLADEHGTAVIKGGQGNADGLDLDAFSIGHLDIDSGIGAIGVGGKDQAVLTLVSHSSTLRTLGDFNGGIGIGPLLKNRIPAG